MKTATASFLASCIAAAVWSYIAAAHHGDARLIAAGFACMAVGFAWVFLELSKWGRI